MDRMAGDNGAARPPALRGHGGLYPPVEPFDRRMLDTGEGHQIYVEQCGHPEGEPVIVVHGGPGGGCSPLMRRFFDPARYRIVLFDQRGCGRSRPVASIVANTTRHLIDDIDMIRAALDLPPAILFGGSWGATLALAYAQARPGSVCGLVLRGVFLGEASELDWFYRGGAARFYPDLWARFLAPLPEDERADPIAAYHRRLFCGDMATEMQFAQPWVQWENALAAVDSAGAGPVPAEYARAFARLECHYFAHGCFLASGQILRDRPKIEHLPAVIVQGRCDMVCPPDAAYRLTQGWALADLRLIAAAGHALSEPGIMAELVRVMDHW